MSLLKISIPILILILVLYPFSTAIYHRELIGAGPDVVSTLWGMWWFHQEGASAILGTETTLVNYPYGAKAIVLAPTSAFLWGSFQSLLGQEWALAAVIIVQIVGFSWATAWVSSILGVSKPWHWVAALAVLVPRIMVFGVGEASLVSIIALGIPLGLGAIILGDRKDGWFFFGMFVCCGLWIALENPYLAPILPLVAIFMIWKGQQKKKIVVALFFLIGGMVVLSKAFAASASPDYPREKARQMVHMLGIDWEIVDLVWARATIGDLFWPKEVLWTTGTADAVVASGGYYLGISVCLLALYALAAKKMQYLWLLGILSVIISMGSMQYGITLPFLFLNQLMDWVARPLTQPTRFLMVALMCFSICTAWTIEQLATKHRSLAYGAIFFLLCDGFFFGGLGLKPPQTKMPNLTCDVSEANAILTWPYDAQDGEGSSAKLLQMNHEKPAAHKGIASWKLLEQRVDMGLRGSRFQIPISGTWNEERLMRFGFSGVLVAKGWEKELSAYSSRFVDCGDFYWVPFVVKRKGGRGL